MERTQEIFAAELRRSSRTLRRWNELGLLAEIEVRKRAEHSYQTARRPAVDADRERDLLARIRFRVGQEPPVGFVAAELFRHVRSLMDQYGCPGWLGGQPDDAPKRVVVPSGLQREILKILPQTELVPSAIRQQVERETGGLSARHVAWLQAYEWLRAGIVTWDRLEPKDEEIRALRSVGITAEMRPVFDRVRKDWGKVVELLGLDLGYLNSRSRRHVRSDPSQEFQQSMAEQTLREFDTRAVERVWRRFDGHPRIASIDSDAAYLLGITRQSAFYLRRSVEHRLGKALRV